MRSSEQVNSDKVAETARIDADLIASFLHGAVNYSVLLLQRGVLTVVQTEVYIAGFAVAVTAIALWLRWRKSEGSLK